MGNKKKDSKQSKKDQESTNKKLTSGMEDDPLEKIVETASKFKVPGLDKEEAWKSLYEKISETEENHGDIRGSRLIKIITYSAAASIILFISFFAAYHFSEKVIIVPRGQHQIVYLPDSSRVVLNADSEIIFSRLFWSLNRRVQFSGEAFFTVKKGSKFRVICDYGEVSVLGTSFNVFSRDDEFEIKCFTGKVEVSVQKNETVLLNATEAVSYNPKDGKTSGVYHINSQTAKSWLDGEYRFEQVPLRKVFDKLERQFDVTVLYSDTANRKYTGTFSNKDLKLALDLICIPMNLKYSFIDEHTVRIN